MSGGRSFGLASVHVGEDWQVKCWAYPAELPILAVDGGNCSVTITIAGRSAPRPGCIEFARELVAGATRFAAECERLHEAAQSGSAPDPAAGGSPAGNAAA